MKNALEELLDLAAKDDTNDDPWLMAYGIERQARDQYELYKEAAEAWAADRTALDNGWSYNHEHCCWTCMECYVALQPFDRSPVLHAADCKAARILNLKMEGAT